MKVKTFNIEGMTCSSCSSAIEKTVGKIDGVIESNVNLAVEKLSVKIPDDFDTNIIVKTVTELGYGISLEKEEIKKSKR